MGSKPSGVLGLVLGLIATLIAAGLYGYAYETLELDWPKWIEALVFCFTLIPLIVGVDSFYRAFRTKRDQ